MPELKVSKDILLDGAQMSLAATTAAIAGFLKERNIPIKDFVAYMGDNFEGMLGDMEGRGADEVMEHLLKLEVLPMGAEIVSSKMTPDTAEVTLTALPPQKVLEKFGTSSKDFLEGFGVTQKEFASIYESYAPAAKAIGMTFRHHSRDSQEVLTLERKH
ncbi:MAG: hypothetical protein Q7R50_06010 [Dehalococcoidales bacterium]|nr:hypothetical protein [Dehalococcoidales bacterium]